MVNEADMKNAFRIAYRVVSLRDMPEFTTAYFMGVTDEFVRLVSENKENNLLRHLLVGIYGYLEEEARKKAND